MNPSIGPRMYFVAQAMRGLLAGTLIVPTGDGRNDAAEWVARYAVLIADATLAEMEKPECERS